MSEKEAFDTFNSFDELHPRVPEGWKLVPVEPNAGMLEAAVGWREVDDREPVPSNSEYDMFDRAYRAMLAAAPAYRRREDE